MLTSDMVYANQLRMVNYEAPFIRIIKNLVQTYVGSGSRGQSFDSYIIDILAKGDTMLYIGFPPLLCGAMKEQLEEKKY